MGQCQSQNSEHLRLAQQCFQAVGSSPAECDTIPGEMNCNKLLSVLLPSFSDPTSLSPLRSLTFDGPRLRHLLVLVSAGTRCQQLSLAAYVVLVNLEKGSQQLNRCYAYLPLVDNTLCLTTIFGMKN